MSYAGGEIYSGENFLMTFFIHQNETDRDRKVRAALEAVLESGETLLEYTQGKFGPFLATQEYLIGLTRRRIVLVQKGQAGGAISIQITYISAITFDAAKRGSKPVMRIFVRRGFSETAVDVSVPFTSSGYWVPFAENLARQFAAVHAPGEAATQTPDIQQVLSQADDLRRLGLPDLAREILNEEATRNPSPQLDEHLQDPMRQDGSDKLAMRVAAGLYGIVILILVWQAFRGQATIGIGLVLAILAVINLLHGKQKSRRTALTYSLFMCAFNIWHDLTIGSYLDIIIWSSFALSMVLLLTGRSRRVRIGMGGAVFAAGVLGVMAFFLLGPTYFPQAVDAVIGIMPAPRTSFSDDFSRNQGWAARKEANTTAGLENGAYAIQLNSPDKIYVSFPPLSYFPTRGEVDFQVPSGFDTSAAGMYGLVCRWQSDTKHYVVFIDPFRGQYSVLRVEGEDVTALTEPGLLPADGLRKAGEKNRIGLSCQDNQVILTINAEKQTPISDPQMAHFGAGRLGLMIMTNQDIPDEGFKVLFDNAVFWPAEN